MKRIAVELVPRSEEELRGELKLLKETRLKVDRINVPDLLLWGISPILFSFPFLSKYFFQFSPLSIKFLGIFPQISINFAKWESFLQKFGPLSGLNKKSPVINS